MSIHYLYTLLISHENIVFVLFMSVVEIAYIFINSLDEVEVLEEDNCFIEILLKRSEDIKANLIDYFKGPAHESRTYWRLYSHESYDVWSDLDILPDNVFKNRFRLSRTQFGILLDLLTEKYQKQTLI